MSRVNGAQCGQMAGAGHGQTVISRDWVCDVKGQWLGTGSKSVIDKAHTIVLRKIHPKTNGQGSYCLQGSGPWGREIKGLPLNFVRVKPEI